MQTLNSLLQLLLVIAVFFYFGGFIAPPPLKWRLWRWAACLVALVFLVALIVVEARAHPIVALCILAVAPLLAYGVLQLRHEHRERPRRRPAPTPFLNLRMSGKTAVDTEAEHPFGERDNEENQE